MSDLLQSPQTIIALAQEGRFVIEDYKPLAESLEWDLGQIYLRQRGSQAFIGDARPIPFVVNNDGVLSANAAELLFHVLANSEPDEGKEPLFVLELGIGVGLFARFFLDCFKGLCQKHGKNFYQRLTYIAADRSEQMMADLCRNGGEMVSVHFFA